MPSLFRYLFWLVLLGVAVAGAAASFWVNRQPGLAPYAGMIGGGLMILSGVLLLLSGRTGNPDFDRRNRNRHVVIAAAMVLAGVSHFVPGTWARTVIMIVAPVLMLAALFRFPRRVFRG